MVKAGVAVDQTIAQLIPLLDAGDIIIDGGNSDFQDSENRAKLCQSHELLFVGSGISVGEEGARFGPSIMPGGDSKAWPAIKNIFQTIEKSDQIKDTKNLDSFCLNFLVAPVNKFQCEYFCDLCRRSEVH